MFNVLVLKNLIILLLEVSRYKFLTVLFGAAEIYGDFVYVWSYELIEALDLFSHDPPELWVVVNELDRIP